MEQQFLEMNLIDLGECYKMLPDPDFWNHQVKNGIMKNGVDDTNNYYFTVGGKDIGFKIRYVNEMAVEWRPVQKIIIRNSDEESFKRCKLIGANHKDGTPLSKEELDAYNNRLH